MEPGQVVDEAGAVVGDGELAVLAVVVLHHLLLERLDVRAEVERRRRLLLLLA